MLSRRGSTSFAIHSGLVVGMQHAVMGGKTGLFCKLDHLAWHLRKGQVATAPSNPLGAEHSPLPARTRQRATPCISIVCIVHDELHCTTTWAQPGLGPLSLRILKGGGILESPVESWEGLHCRSSQRVDASRQQVEKAAAGGWVKAYTYDLSSMQSVREFAAAVRQDVPSLNVLLNNAGQ